MDSLLSYENLACSDRPPSSRRILIIDDDPALLEALGDMLRFRLSNVIVETCGDPAVAVQQARHGHYDLILCDLCMSGNNGFELLPLLRRATPRAVVALMSAISDESIHHTAHLLGAATFLPKPFDRERLSARITDLLSRPGPAVPDSFDRLAPISSGPAQGVH